MSSTRSLLGAALAIAVAFFPAAAAASPTQLSIMMDDDLLLYRDDSTTVRALTRMQAMGVDAVRVTVLWRTIAESARPSLKEIYRLKGTARKRAVRQRHRFDADDPHTYPTRNWDRYDNLVKAATQRGIGVYFNVTGPGPSWAHRTPPTRLRRLRASYRPRVGAFKQFVKAVGRRFDGAYRDENGARDVLPRVSMWSLWNEPNQAGWLSPQWVRHGSRWVPAAPAIFRRLVQQGYEGLVATGHRADNDIVLLGETAPLGSGHRSERTPMYPKRFLRELFCVRANGAPYRGRSAQLRGCADFRRKGALNATGYAHHPYTKKLAPTQRHRAADAVTMANLGELGALLDGLARTTGNLPAGLPLYLTEFGFETSPPDRYAGISLALQAKYAALGEYMAWANPRVAAQSQFLLADVAPLERHTKGTKAYWATYQSGLFTDRGKPKPAAYAYTMPFRAARTAAAAPAFDVWGQLRFLPNGAADVAAIQWRPLDNSAAWATIGPPVAIDRLGYFTATRTAPSATPGEWRAAWSSADGKLTLTSPGTKGD
jgi:hypothetical protein